MRGKALVTGGAGFIGSQLCERLLAHGWEVWALDDLSTGSRANVAHLLDRRDFHLVVDSVLPAGVVNELVNRCDVVYHLAAAVGVRLSKPSAGGPSTTWSGSCTTWWSTRGEHPRRRWSSSSRRGS